MDEEHTSGESGQSSRAEGTSHHHHTSTDVRVFAEGLSLSERIAAFRGLVREWAFGLYHGLVEGPAFEKIEKEAEDVEDEFFFACFADAFGIPSPVSYYTVELLPYLAERFEQWERRMWDRESLLERKGQQYHVH